MGSPAVPTAHSVRMREGGPGSLGSTGIQFPFVINKAMLPALSRLILSVGAGGHQPFHFTYG